MPTKRTYMVYYAVAILIWGSESVLTKAFLLDSRSWAGASAESGEPAPSGER
jgi:hypothetical protein